MRKASLALTLICLLSIPFTTQANNVEIRLSNETVRFIYASTISTKQGLSEFDIGYQYSEDISDADHIFHTGFHISGDDWTQMSQLGIKIGARLMISTPGKLDLGAIAVGGQVRVNPADRISASAAFYYAPKVTSFQDADKYTEANLKVGYQVLPDAQVSLGWTSIRTGLEIGGDITLHEGLHLGMSLAF